MSYREVGEALRIEGTVGKGLLRIHETVSLQGREDFAWVLTQVKVGMRQEWYR